MKFKLVFTCVLLLALALTVTAQDDDFPYDLLEDSGIEFNEVDLDIDENFRDDGAWDFYEDETGYVRSTDGHFEIQRDETQSFLWGQDNQLRSYENSVVQVETEQLSDEDNNGYGVMCRKDPDFTSLDGYAFLVSGDGFVRIMKYRDGEAIDLVAWESNDAVNQGEDENELVAVCVDNYLGFYVNGELVAEAEDDEYTEGVTAFLAIIYEEGEEVVVAFDNLMVWEVEAELGEGRTNDTSTGGDIDDLTDDIQDMIADEGDVDITLEDVVLVETFDEQGDWQDVEVDATDFEVVDGVYRLEHSNSGFFVSGQNEDDEYEDIVVTVATENISDHEASGHGLMCRADNGDNINENGYAFVVSSDGFYTIGYWEDNSYFSLLGTESGWDNTSVPEVGDGAINQITIVCVGEYLALFVNGEFIDSVEDDTYDSGFVSAGVVAFNDETIEVEFDNFVVWEADD